MKVIPILSDATRNGWQRIGWIDTLSLITLLWLAVAAMHSPRQTWASEEHSYRADKRCLLYRETGKLICDSFLEYWQQQEQQGSSKFLGRPISNPFSVSSTAATTTQTTTVQYFDFAVLRVSADNPTLDNVQHLQVKPGQYECAYPRGELDARIFGEYPLRVEDAQILEVSDYSPAAGPGTVITYTTSLTAIEVRDFYNEILQKNNWECTYDCSGTRGNNSAAVPDYLSFCWRCDPDTEPVKYVMRIHIAGSGQALRTVTVDFVYGPPQREPPPGVDISQLPYTPPTPQPPSPSGPCLSIGMPDTGAGPMNNQIVALVSVITILALALIGGGLAVLRLAQSG